MIETCLCRHCLKVQQVGKEIRVLDDQTEEIYKCKVCNNIVRTSRLRDLKKKMEVKQDER